MGEVFLSDAGQSGAGGPIFVEWVWLDTTKEAGGAWFSTWIPFR